MANTSQWTPTMDGANYKLPLLDKLRASRKTKRKERLAEIAYTNMDIVQDLLHEAELLAKKGNAKEGNRLLKIAQKVQQNNRNYWNTVVDVLSNGD